MERKKFITSLSKYTVGNKILIVGGDFNFVEDTAMDKAGGNPAPGSIGKEEMKELKRDFLLEDVFRFQNHFLKHFTFSGQGVSARLDRFYTNVDFFTCWERLSGTLFIIRP